MFATIFTFIFALACFTTFLCALRKEWKDARLASAVIAILSFLIALLSAKPTVH